MIHRIKTWLHPAAFHWTAWELCLARLGIALLIFYFGCFSHLKPFTPDPSKLNGLAKIMPLVWMLEPTAVLVLRVLSAVGLVLFVAGWMPLLTLLPGLFTLLGTGALRNSKGDISHSTQVLAMSALAVWLTYLYAACRSKECRSSSVQSQRRAMLAVLLVLSASYVSSGIIKMKSTGGHWIARAPNMSVQMIKSNLSDYYSDPAKPVSKFTTETAPAFFTGHPYFAMAFFGSGLILELGAFLMLLSRRWALLWGGSMLLMHAGISLLMDIEFWNHMGLLTVVCVIPGLVSMLNALGRSPSLSRDAGS